MTKMKQATLFNLKSWKKVTANEISKYKDILDNHTEVYPILKTLSTLKKMNLSRDLLLSSDIGSSLKKLTKHPSIAVTIDVKELIVHWNLEFVCGIQKQDICLKKDESSCSSGNCKSAAEPINVMQALMNIKKSNPAETKEVAGSSEGKIKTNVTGGVRKDKPKLESMTVDEFSKDEVKILKECHKLKDDKEACQDRKTTSDQLYKLQTEKQIAKKAVMNELKKREINRHLQIAIKGFVEEVGKQEVEMYLKTLA